VNGCLSFSRPAIKKTLFYATQAWLLLRQHHKIRQLYKTLRQYLLLQLRQHLFPQYRQPSADFSMKLPTS
jgi:hypothetical protein